MGRSVEICHYTAFYVAKILVAFLQDQIMPHYWLTCFSVPMRMSFSDEKLSRKFNLTYRHIDDLISFDNKIFEEFISDIYQCAIHTQPVLALNFLQFGFLNFSLRIWIVVFLPLFVCLVLVYFIRLVLQDVTVLIYVPEIFRMSQILARMYLGSVKSKKLVFLRTKISSLMIRS